MYSNYPSFLPNHNAHFYFLVLPLSSFPSFCASLPLIPPSSFLKATCSQPVWLSCTLPMKGFLLGWDWVQPSRAWLGPRSPPPTTAQTTPHACSGLVLSPRRRLLVSAALNCRQQLKRARERDIVERGEGTVLACWTVTWQAWIQRFVFLLSNPGSVLVGFIKIDVVFIKCWNESYSIQNEADVLKESWWKTRMKYEPQYTLPYYKDKVRAIGPLCPLPALCATVILS